MMKQSDKPAPNATKKSKRHLTPAWALFSVLIIYFLAQIISVNVIYLLQTIRGWNDQRIERWFDTVPAKFMLYVLIAFVGLWATKLLLKWLGTRWQEIGFKKPQLSDAGYAIVGYGYYLILFIASTIIIRLLLPELNFDQEQQLGFSTSIEGFHLLLAFVSLVVLPPLYEETLMRGVLYTGLRSKYSLWIAGFITSVIFALAHLQWGSGAPLLWAAAIDTFILSVVLVGLREKTGSIWPSIGLHAIKNLVAFSLLFVFKIV